MPSLYGQADRAEVGAKPQPHFFPPVEQPLNFCVNPDHFRMDYEKGLSDLLELQKAAEEESNAQTRWLGEAANTLDEWLRAKILEMSDFQVDYWRTDDNSEKMPAVGDHVHNALGVDGSCTRCRMRLKPKYE